MRENEGSRIAYEFIDVSSPYYAQTVELRFDVFYKESGLGLEAVQDGLENQSCHLAAILSDRVVGYIRLTVEDKTGKLTQWVVSPDMRGTKIGLRLYQKISAKAKELGARKIVGEIRLPVAKAAAAYGFQVSEEIFTSPKTGIPHRKIEKTLEGNSD